MGLKGRPLLDHVLERVLAVRGLDDVVLATTSLVRDDALLSIANARGVRVHRGSEADVMCRIWDAAQAVNADVIMRVTADCPLFAPDVAESILRVFVMAHRIQEIREAPWIYVSNDTSRSGYPDGLDVEVFATYALTASMIETARPLDGDENKRKVDREHVTGWMRRSLNTTVFAHAGTDFTRLKLSVDRQDDFDRVSAIYQHLPPGRLDWAATAEACRAVGLIAADEVAC